MPEDRALIHFRCTNAKHQDARGGVSDTLTIHEGMWAYCPHDIRVKGHEWEPTGGVSMSEVRRLRKKGAS